MTTKKIKFIAILLSVLFISESFSQSGTTITGAKNNAITTAVPFLRINPDARAGALGYAAVATHPDANGIFANVSKMAFIESTNKDGSINKAGNNFGVSFTFIPWLRGIAQDVYLADLVGYYNLRNKKNPEIQQSIAASLRYFSLGNITFTNDVGDETGQGNPNELAVDLNYARKLSKNLGVGIGLRYIYSNLGTGAPGSNLKPGHAVAADLSMFYTTPIKMKSDILKGMDFNFGFALTNIGSKMTYTENGNDADKDFLPANMGIGFGLEMDIDDHNEIDVYFDVNKLLVPTPDTIDANNNAVYDYKEKSQIGAIFTSFGDAPTAGEEFSEFNIGGGIEYTYNNLFMLRLGYFYEAPTKGNRNFLSAGAGVKYSVFTLNAAYIIPTHNPPGPLDNTMYFSLLFDFNSGVKKEKAPAE